MDPRVNNERFGQWTGETETCRVVVSARAWTTTGLRVRRRTLDAARIVTMENAFQIVSVDRSLTNWGHCHITALDTTPQPGSPDHWPITWVLGALGGGDLFYVITKLEGPAFARPYRCMCGFATIRTTPSDEMNDGLQSVSMDEWEPLISNLAAL